MSSENNKINQGPPKAVNAFNDDNITLDDLNKLIDNTCNSLNDTNSTNTEKKESLITDAQENIKTIKGQTDLSEEDKSKIDNLEGKLNKCIEEYKKKQTTPTALEKKNNSSKDAVTTTATTATAKPPQSNEGATINAKNYQKTKKDIIAKKKKEKEELTQEYNILQSTFSEMTFSDEITKCYEQSRLNEFKDKIALIDKEIEIIETGAFLDIFGDKYYSDIVLSITSNSDYLGIQSLNQFLKNYNIQSKFKDNITAIIAAFSAHFRHGNTNPRVCDSNMRIIYPHLRYRHRVLQTQRELFGLSPTGHHYASIAEQLDTFLQSVACSGGFSMNSSNSKGKAPGAVGLSAGPLTNIATSLRTIASRLDSGAVLGVGPGAPGSEKQEKQKEPKKQMTPEEQLEYVKQLQGQSVLYQGYKGAKGAYAWLKSKLSRNKEIKQEIEETKEQLANSSNSSETNKTLNSKIKELQKELDNSKKEIAKIYKDIKQKNKALKKHLVLSHIFKSFGNTEELNKLQKDYDMLYENAARKTIERDQLYIAKKTQNITIQELEKEKKALLQQKESLEKQIETLSKKSNKTPEDKLVLKKLLVILHVQNALQSLQGDLQKGMYEGRIQNMSTEYANEKAKLMNELSDLTKDFNNKNIILEDTKNKLSTYIQKEREYINKLKKQVVIVYLLEKLQVDDSTVNTVRSELNEEIRKYKQELDEERNKHEEEINILKDTTKKALNEQKIQSQENINKLKSELKKQLVIQYIYSKLTGDTLLEQSDKILELENELKEKEAHYIQIQDDLEKEYEEHSGREISDLIETNNLITMTMSSRINELKQTIDTLNGKLKNYGKMSSAIYSILGDDEENIEINEGENEVFEEVERQTANVPSSEAVTPPVVPPTIPEVQEVSNNSVINAENTNTEEQLNYSKISDIPIIKTVLEDISKNKEKYQKYNMNGIKPSIISDIRNLFGRENKTLTDENINNIIVKLQDIFQYGINYGTSMTKSDILNMLLLLEAYGRKQITPYSIIKGIAKEDAKNTANIGDNFYEFIKYIKESNEYLDEKDDTAGSMLLEKIEEVHPILAEVPSGPKRKKVAPPSIPQVSNNEKPTIMSNIGVTTQASSIAAKLMAEQYTQPNNDNNNLINLSPTSIKKSLFKKAINRVTPSQETKNKLKSVGKALTPGKGAAESTLRYLTGQ